MVNPPPFNSPLGLRLHSCWRRSRSAPRRTEKHPWTRAHSRRTKRVAFAGLHLRGKETPRLANNPRPVLLFPPLPPCRPGVTAKEDRDGEFLLAAEESRRDAHEGVPGGKDLSQLLAG